MNKELLANIRNILIPTLASRLKKTNYEGQGEKDALEFTHDMTEIFDLAEQQLSAQPEQTDCEYCHEDSDGCVRSIEKNSHAWLVRRGRTMKLRVGFNGRHSECDILFCPMCGRRLTDG